MFFKSVLVHVSRRNACRGMQVRPKPITAGNLHENLSRTCFTITRRPVLALQSAPSTFFISRAMSSEEIKNIDIQEYLKLKEDPKTSIIDVREKSEIAETGVIPGGFNIPLGEISNALQTGDSSFQKNYQRCKPSNDDRIVFSCRSGKRSLAAAQIAKKLGYDNVLNLAGGWLAWEEYSKK